MHLDYHVVHYWCVPSKSEKFGCSAGLSSQSGGHTQTHTHFTQMTSLKGTLSLARVPLLCRERQGLNRVLFVVSFLFVNHLSCMLRQVANTLDRESFLLLFFFLPLLHLPLPLSSLPPSTKGGRGKKIAQGRTRRRRKFRRKRGKGGIKSQAKKREQVSCQTNFCPPGVQEQSQATFLPLCEKREERKGGGGENKNAGAVMLKNKKKKVFFLLSAPPLPFPPMRSGRVLQGSLSFFMIVQFHMLLLPPR